MLNIIIRTRILNTCYPNIITARMSLSTCNVTTEPDDPPTFTTTSDNNSVREKQTPGDALDGSDTGE